MFYIYIRIYRYIFAVMHFYIRLIRLIYLSKSELGDILARDMYRVQLVDKKRVKHFILMFGINGVIVH